MSGSVGVRVAVTGIDQEGSYTVYHLSVKIEREGRAPLAWVVRRRYRELAAFKNKIKDHLPSAAQFPGKTIGKASSEQVRRRMSALSGFFDTLLGSPLPMTVQREIYELLDVRTQASRTSEMYWRALKQMGRALPSASVLLQTEKWRREKVGAAHATNRARTQGVTQGAAASPGAASTPLGARATGQPPTSTARLPVIRSPGTFGVPPTMMVDVSGHDLQHRVRQVRVLCPRRRRACCACCAAVAGPAHLLPYSPLPTRLFLDSSLPPAAAYQVLPATLTGLLALLILRAALPFFACACAFVLGVCRYARPTTPGHPLRSAPLTLRAFALPSLLLLVRVQHRGAGFGCRAQCRLLRNTARPSCAAALGLARPRC